MTFAGQIARLFEHDMDNEFKVTVEEHPKTISSPKGDHYEVFNVTIPVAVKNPRLTYDEGTYVDHEGVFLAETLTPEYLAKGYEPIKFDDGLDAFNDELMDEIKAIFTA